MKTFLFNQTHISVEVFIFRFGSLKNVCGLYKQNICSVRDTINRPILKTLGLLLDGCIASVTKSQQVQMHLLHLC